MTDVLIIVLSISTFVLLVLAISVMILFIIVLKRIKYISERAQEGTDAVVEMVENVKESIINPSIVAGIIKVFKSRSKK